MHPHRQKPDRARPQPHGSTILRSKPGTRQDRDDTGQIQPRSCRTVSIADTVAGSRGRHRRSPKACRKYPLPLSRLPVPDKPRDRLPHRKRGNRSAPTTRLPGRLRRSCADNCGHRPPHQPKRPAQPRHNVRPAIRGARTLRPRRQATADRSTAFPVRIASRLPTFSNRTKESLPAHGPFRASPSQY